MAPLWTALNIVEENPGCCLTPTWKSYIFFYFVELYFFLIVFTCSFYLFTAATICFLSTAECVGKSLEIFNKTPIAKHNFCRFVDVKTDGMKVWVWKAIQSVVIISTFCFYLTWRFRCKNSVGGFRMCVRYEPPDLFPVPVKKATELVLFSCCIVSASNEDKRQMLYWFCFIR